MRIVSHTVRLGLILLLSVLVSAPASGQRVAKYGADFLAGGVDARALGMGGAQVALASSVNAVYWNAAGLEHITGGEIALMHAERFGGIVSFDYGAFAMPVSAQSTVAFAFFRSGVNDIKNTLDAWDPERDQPKPDPSSFITTFSAADYAFFISYSRSFSSGLRAGVTSKVVRRSIGDFASAWGYAFDVSAQWDTGRWRFGANAQDLSTMLQSWSVDSGRLSALSDVFGGDIPKGGSEIVLPVVRLGSAYEIEREEDRFTFALDTDLAFDGSSANAIDLGGAVALYPRLGAEYAYRDVLALRVGLSRILNTQQDGWTASPTVGGGFVLGPVSLDYGFGDFAGLVSSLGYSHRISIRVALNHEALDRPEE